ncbi:MAG TPA: DUF4384 domain-containing protein [Sulfurimonas sp.]|nr:DUF4384 domain-containing protein [Sulfurimonas sp.]
MLPVRCSALQVDTNATAHNAMEQKVIYLAKHSNIVYARSGRASYLTGDTIGIEIKLRKNAFMYFWSVRKDKKPRLILPNKFESYNAYKKDIAYTVPESSANYSFISNDVGVEHVYILSSKKKLKAIEVKKIMQKIASTKKDKKVQETKSNDTGIMVVAKKPNYDVARFDIMIVQNTSELKKSSEVVKISSSPYGSAKGYYPLDKK